jgi:outer membrane protein OmpA-like peptidoglycan-associated protein
VTAPRRLLPDAAPPPVPQHGAARRGERAADVVAGRFGPMPRGPQRAREPAREGALPSYQGPELGRGEPLPLHERALLERELGVDLGEVRVHADSRAAAAARDHGALAFAVGPRVVFADGAYRPGTAAGRALLAHEVTHAAAQQLSGRHVVQREPSARPGGIGRTPPAEPFDRVVDGRADEDAHVLFGQDDAAITPAARTRLQAIARDRNQPVQVEIDGYASTEGDDEYDVNLSAHRAVAVRRVLQVLLPAGSRFHLVAHGETVAFGDRPGNRRAGVLITDLPPLPPITVAGGQVRPPPGTGVPPYTLGVPPLQLGGVPPVTGLQPGRPSLLTPGPHLIPPSFTLTPPGTAAPGATAQGLARSPIVPRPPLTPGSLLPGPRWPLQPNPLFSVPPLGVTPGVDWAGIEASYRSRGLAISDRDAAAISTHFTNGYELLVRQLGLPPSQAATLMNIFTSSAIDRELARENPNVIDRLNQDVKNAYPDAWSTPVFSIDLLNPPWRGK